MNKIIDTFADQVNNTYDSLYIKDINVKIKFNNDAFTIIDLTNALKNGKTCKAWRCEGKTYKFYNAAGWWLLHEIMNENNVDFVGLVTMLMNGEKIVGDNTSKILGYDGVEWQTGEMKGCRVYSPFAKVPKQDFSKITPAKLPKAIACGQVVSIVTEQYLTDDYLFDVATNFQEGRVKNIHEMAEDLVRNADGWRMSKKNDKQYYLDCYSFASYIVNIA